MGLILDIVCMLKRKDLTIYAGFLLVLKVLLGANYQKSCHVSVTYISFFCALLSLTEEAKALRSKRSPRIAHERARTSVITEDN